MSELFRVETANWELYRHPDGRTRFPYLEACTIARRIGGRIIR